MVSQNYPKHFIDLFDAKEFSPAGPRPLAPYNLFNPLVAVLKVEDVYPDRRGLSNEIVSYQKLLNQFVNGFNSVFESNNEKGLNKMIGALTAIKTHFNIAMAKQEMKWITIEDFIYCEGLIFSERSLYQGNKNDPMFNSLIADEYHHDELLKHFHFKKIGTPYEMLVAAIREAYNMQANILPMLKGYSSMFRKLVNDIYVHVGNNTKSIKKTPQFRLEENSFFCKQILVSVLSSTQTLVMAVLIDKYEKEFLPISERNILSLAGVGTDKRIHNIFKDNKSVYQKYLINPRRGQWTLVPLK